MNQYNTSLVREFIKVFSEKSEEIVIVDALSGRGKSGREFLDEIYRVSEGFQKHGMLPGDTIVILTQDIVMYAVVIFASLLSGGRVAIIDPAMGRENIQRKLKILKPKFYLIDGTILDGMHVQKVSQFFHHIFRNIYLDDLQEASTIFVHGRSLFKGNSIISINKFEQWNDKPTMMTFDSSSDAIIVFTGGTTDEPKGVIHSHESLLASKGMIDLILGDEKTFYADLPHFLLFGLLLGKQVVTGKDSLSPKQLHKIFLGYGVQSVFFAPYKIQEFINNSITFPGCVRHLLTGSAPVFRSFLERVLTQGIIHDRLRISCIYGMTEILPIAVIDGREKIGDVGDIGDNLGRVLDGIEWRLIDNELQIKAPHAMKSYLGESPIEYTSTGDLVEIEGHSLRMIGRKKDMIIKGNYNIYPSLYEGTILSIPGVRDCALFGMRIDDYDEKVILLVDGEIFKDDLYKNLTIGEFSIDSFAMPDEIIIGKIPRHGRQKKINKTILQKLYREGILGK